ncbi:hypothetical protein ACFQVA_41270 [Actinomadura keratinilytica]
MLSGRTPQALAEQAARLSAHLTERPALRPADVALSLATTRAALEHRAVAVGASPEELRSALDSVAARPRNSVPRADAWPCCSPARVRNASVWGGGCTRRTRSSPRRSTRCARGSTVSWAGR